MNKGVIILFFLLAFSEIKSQIPNWEWAKPGDGTGGEGWALVVDNKENIYLCGNYIYDISFGTFSLTSSGSEGYITKYDSSGNVLWLKGTQGANSSVSTAFVGVATDIVGNIYLPGELLGGTVSFGSHSITSIGDIDFFLVKYDPYGNSVWVKSAYGTVSNLGNSISINNTNDIWISGSYTSTYLDFDIDVLMNSGSDDIFVAKYDSSGNFLWVKGAAGTGSDISNAIVATNSGDAYVTGYFSSPSIIFGNDTLFNYGNRDFFLVKYDNDGNVVWAKHAGGSGMDWGYGLTLDSSGNVYVAGYSASATMTFDSLVLTGSISPANLFIAKYDTSGNVLWVKKYSNGVSPYSIVLDSLNNMYVTGERGYQAMQMDTIAFPAISHGDPMIIVKIDSTGHAVWGDSFSGGGDDQSMLAIGKTGNIYLCGDYVPDANPFIIGSTTLTNNMTATESPFLAKLHYPLATGVSEITSNEELSIFPNPFENTISIRVKSSSLSEVTLYDITSRKIKGQSFQDAVILNTEQLAKGIYFYEISSKNGITKNGKLIKE